MSIGLDESLKVR